MEGQLASIARSSSSSTRRRSGGRLIPSSKFIKRPWFKYPMSRSEENRWAESLECPRPFF